MPILIYYNNQVYTKESVDNLLKVKADKIIPSNPDNIALLTGGEGNLKDSGKSIEDIALPDFADGGII